MKKYLVTLALISLSFVSYSQAPYWNQPINDSTANYQTMVHNADSFYVTLPPDTAEGSEFALYEKWKTFWEPRVDETGSFEPYASAMTSMFNNTNYCNGSGIYNEQWSQVGHSFTEINGTSSKGQGWATKIVTNSDNSKLYLGAKRGGLWKDSTDTWINLTDNMRGPIFGIVDVKVDPLDDNIIYITSALNGRSAEGLSFGFLKSTNAGNAWRRPSALLSVLNTDNGYKENASQIYISPIANNADSSNIIFVSSNDKLYKSEDAGNSFSMINHVNSITRFNGKIIQILGSFNTSGIIFVLTDLGELWYSSNNGQSWTHLDNANSNLMKSNSSKIPVRIHVSKNDKIFLMYPSSEVETNANNIKVVIELSDVNSLNFTRSVKAQQWIQIGGTSGARTPTPLTGFYVSDIDDQIMYAIYRSNSSPELNISINGGTSFTEDPRSDWHGDANDLFVVSDPTTYIDKVYVANDGGLNLATIQYTIDGSNNVTQVSDISTNLNSNNLHITEIYGFDIDPTSNWISAGCQDLAVYTKYNNQWASRIWGDGFSVAYDSYTNNPNEPDEFPKMICENNNRRFRNTQFSPAYSESMVMSLTELPNYTDELVVDAWGRTIIGIFYETRDANGNIVISENRVYSKDIGENSINKNNYITFSNSGNQIKGIASSRYNKDVIYIGKSGPGGSNRADRLYKSSNFTSPTPTWQDIGTLSNVLPLNIQGITEIITDPYSENGVWVCVGNKFSDYSASGNDVLRVYYSPNGGEIDATTGQPIWLPINEGIEVSPGENSGFNINDIELDESTGGMYLATDIGVYYNPSPKDPSSEWVCYNKDLPIIPISQLRIDYCRRKVLASTSGRGLYEADLAEAADYTLDISSNTIWDNEHRKLINSSITVKAGKTLTIKTELVLPSYAKIIVEKGAKLIIDGGTITTRCNNLWAGIFIEGDNSLSQLPVTNQGYVILKNGASIENAKTAITLAGLDANGSIDPAKSGGIVKAFNSTFLNNKEDIYAAAYRYSYSPSGSGTDKIYVNNQTLLSDCEFRTTGDYKGTTSEIKPHVTLFGVLWVDFKGCTFTDARWGNSVTDELSLRDGIVSSWASYRINNLTSLSPYGIPSVGKKNTFNDMRYAITSYETKIPWFNLTVPRPSSVVDAEFHCLGGILYSDVDHPILTRNEFNIKGYFSPNGGLREIDAYGIFMDNCDGYQIEGNDAIGDLNVDPTHNEAVGIVHTANRSRINTVYRNRMDDVLLGAESYGKNKDSRTTAPFGTYGLHYECNEFANTTDNQWDIYATQEYGQPISLANGLPQQGSQSRPAGNLFGVYSGNPYIHFLNATNLTNVDYYHHDVASDARVVPTIKTNVSNKATLNPRNTSSCPDETAQDIFIGTLDMDDLGADRLVLKQKRTLKEQVTDGGPTVDLLTEILNVTPSTYSQLYADIVSYSPYLSTDVLSAISSATTPFSHLDIRDILLLNPHSSRTPSILSILQNRTDSFPTGYLSTIDSASQNYTTRDTLHDEMYVQAMLYENQLNNLVRKALNTESEDLFVSVTEPILQAALEPHRWYKLAALYDARGNTSAATALLNTIPVEFTLSIEQLDYHTDFIALRNMALNWQSAGKQITQLDSTDIAALLPYASKTNGIQNEVLPLLVLRDSAVYLPPIYHPMSEFNTTEASPLNNGRDEADPNNISIITDNLNSEQIKVANELTLFPNPTQRVLNIKYNIDSETVSGRLEITDYTGNVLLDTKLINNTGALQLDVSAYRNGTYIVKLFTNDKSIFTKNFTVAR